MPGFVKIPWYIYITGGLKLPLAIAQSVRAIQIWTSNEKYWHPPSARPVFTRVRFTQNQLPFWDLFFNVSYNDGAYLPTPYFSCEKNMAYALIGIYPLLFMLPKILRYYKERYYKGRYYNSFSPICIFPDMYFLKRLCMSQFINNPGISHHFRVLPKPQLVPQLVYKQPSITEKRTFNYREEKGCHSKTNTEV